MLAIKIRNNDGADGGGINGLEFFDFYNQTLDNTELFKSK